LIPNCGRLIQKSNIPIQDCNFAIPITAFAADNALCFVYHCPHVETNCGHLIHNCVPTIQNLRIAIHLNGVAGALATCQLAAEAR